MGTWDVFHADRLEVSRGLSTTELRAAADRGEIGPDDLIRPAGTTLRWVHVADFPALLREESVHDLSSLPTLAGPSDASDVAEALIDDDGDEPVSRFDLDLDDNDSAVALPVTEAIDWVAEPIDEYDPGLEDEEAAEFTLARGSAETVEELDLAAMVDVAFQLVLFFLVTAQTVLYKTLEVPKPNPSKVAGAASQGQGKTLEDLENDFILVEIDSGGAFKVDHEPAPADIASLADRLRGARTTTGRTAMLLTADANTLHRYAVVAYDAANEIGLRIAIASPKTAAGPPPVPPAVPKGPG